MPGECGVTEKKKRKVSKKRQRELFSKFTGDKIRVGGRCVLI